MARGEESLFSEVGGLEEPERGGEGPFCLPWNPTKEERKKATFLPNSATS